MIFSIVSTFGSVLIYNKTTNTVDKIDKKMRRICAQISEISPYISCFSRKENVFLHKPIKSMG